MKKEHGLYKFVEKETGEILYIGKTNNSFKQRIDDHIKAYGIDEKFKPYLDKCKIYITILPNSTETDILERALINQYKPLLNRIDNHKGFSSYININEPEWIDYEIYSKKYCDKKERKGTKNIEDPYQNDIYLGELSGIDYWIDNTYVVKVKGCKKIAEMYVNQAYAFQVMKAIINVCEVHGVVDKDLIIVQGKDINGLIKSHIDRIHELGYWDGIRFLNGSSHGWLSITSYIESRDDNIIELHFHEKTIKILSELLPKKTAAEVI